VITESVSASHVELSTEDVLELFRLAQFCNVSASGVVRVSLIFVREGLTDADCYDNFTERARAELREQHDQLNLI